jgi:hypothetical protein
MTSRVRGIYGNRRIHIRSRGVRRFESAATAQSVGKTGLSDFARGPNKRFCRSFGNKGDSTKKHPPMTWLASVTVSHEKRKNMNAFSGT